MRLCEGCNEILTNTGARYIQETPDSGATLRNGRNRQSFGRCFPKDLIRSILDGETSVCQPCARAAIDLYTGPNAPAADVELQPKYGAHVTCEHCGHGADLDHQRGECFNRTNGRRCECRTLRVT